MPAGRFLLLAVLLSGGCAVHTSGLEYLSTRTEYECPGMVKWHCSALGQDR